MTFQQQFTAYKTIVIKEYFRFIRIWIQTVLPPAITTSLYFVIFGELIGSQLRNIGGYSYMDYIVPGLILLAVISNSYANVVSSFYSSKFQRSVEELLVSPVSNAWILAGFVSGGLIRGLVVGAVVTAVAMCFTNIPFYNPLLSFVVVLLTAILFSLAGFINAVYAKSFDDISIVPTFVLTYLGGIFYSIDMLPAFWQKLSLANPILYMINAMRYGLLGISDTHLLASFGIIIGFITVLFAFALHLLNTGTGIKN